MAVSSKEVAPDRIKRNPDNPRLFFRSEELDTLTSSIRRYGVLVPLVVYEDGNHYVLIDGERRWKCALKLNLSRVPVVIQEKPNALDNLLLMFNIHALREQWDYLTIARKIPDINEMFAKKNKGRKPTEIELSELTGLTRGQIRRCNYLVDLPKKYRDLLEEELALPKSLQKLSEDFFIEMERALKAVYNRIPSAIDDLDGARDALINKFRRKIIKNITDFRKVSKIATSIGNLGIKETKARAALRMIFDIRSKKSIAEIYSEQFEMRYDERKVLLSVDSIHEYLENAFEPGSHIIISDELQVRLSRLTALIRRIVRA